MSRCRGHRRRFDWKLRRSELSVGAAFCTADRAKAKGRFLFRDIAPSFQFFEDPVRRPDHNYSSIQSSFGTCERSPPFPVLSRHPIRCESFLVSPRCGQSPQRLVSSVAGPLSSSVPGTLASSVPGSLTRTVPGPLASSISSSLPNAVPSPLASSIPSARDDSCLLSPTGEFLLR